MAFEDNAYGWKLLSLIFPERVIKIIYSGSNEWNVTISFHWYDLKITLLNVQDILNCTRLWMSTFLAKNIVFVVTISICNIASTKLTMAV